jgi:hypothetical protein
VAKRLVSASVYFDWLLVMSMSFAWFGGLAVTRRPAA